MRGLPRGLSSSQVSQWGASVLDVPSAHLPASGSFDTLSRRFGPPVVRIAGSWSGSHFDDASRFDAATFTIIAAVKTTTADKSVCGRFNDSTTPGKCWFIDLAGGSGKARAVVTNTVGTNAIVTSTTALTGGSWGLIVATFDAAQLLTLYINGVSEGTPVTLAGTPNNTSSAENVYVGRRSSVDTAVYSGALTFSYLAGRSLTAQQVRDLYASDWAPAA